MPPDPPRISRLQGEQVILSLFLKFFHLVRFLLKTLLSGKGHTCTRVLLIDTVNYQHPKISHALTLGVEGQIKGIF